MNSTKRLREIYAVAVITVQVRQLIGGSGSKAADGAVENRGTCSGDIVGGKEKPLFVVNVISGSRQTVGHQFIHRCGDLVVVRAVQPGIYRKTDSFFMNQHA